VITEAYREEQRKLHKNPNYGVMSVSFAPLVTQIIDAFEVTDLLDYGAGKGRLAKHITPNHAVSVSMYEPANTDWDATPEPHEMVTCLDVLEHIEPEYLDEVLDDLQRVTKRIGLFSIHTGPAKKVLSDGRNAHLIQEPIEWWLPKIMERFKLKSMNATNNGFHVIVKVKNGNIDVQ